MEQTLEVGVGSHWAVHLFLRGTSWMGGMGELSSTRPTSELKTRYFSGRRCW